MKHLRNSIETGLRTRECASGPSKEGGSRCEEARNCLPGIRIVSTRLLERRPLMKLSKLTMCRSTVDAFAAAAYAPLMFLSI